MAELKKGPRGLPAIARAREDRGRRGPRWTMQAGLIAAGAVVAGLVAHTVVSGRELTADRQSLLARQRAVASTLGTQWFPLRDRLEADIVAAARDFGGDHVEPEGRSRTLRTQPGLYLRIRAAEGGSPSQIRRVAVDAKKDAFAACLLREPNERGVRGEIDGGAFPEQPWNLGQAYAATRILTDEWIQSVRDADDAMRLRVFDEQYERAVRSEIPLAIDVVSRAQFLLLVLDEDVNDPAARPDGAELTEATLQLVVHPVRVHLFDLKTNKELFRLRRAAGAALVIPAGERAVTDSETHDAMQRQANNCMLARAVDETLSFVPTSEEAPRGAR